MADQIKDGGPAFPNVPDGAGDRWQSWDMGMSLRDYLASKALQGLLANAGGPVQTNGRSGWGLVNCALNDIATLAYQMADAMLAAREVQS